MKNVKSINTLGLKMILVIFLVTLFMFVVGYYLGQGLYLLFN